jgi:hypothetical protein
VLLLSVGAIVWIPLWAVLISVSILAEIFSGGLRLQGKN